LRSSIPVATLAAVDETFTHRGRLITETDLAFLRALVAQHPTASRRGLSRLLCEAWDWRQPNGVVRDMVARGLMLALHRRGVLALPPRRLTPRNPLAVRQPPRPMPVDTRPLRARLDELRPLEIRLVRRTPDEPLFNALIAAHHYLGYTHPVGEHLKYLVSAQGRPLACLAWSSAPRHLGPRDRFIGWSPAARQRNLRLLAYNTRYLILPWVEVPLLASHLLGRVARRMARDWQQVYGHPVYFLETFVDPARFRGTCYRAANWISLGVTTGRGHNAPTKQPRVPVKEILGYPLTPRWRERLTA
jgi:hypothetical protein